MTSLDTPALRQKALQRRRSPRSSPRPHCRRQYRRASLRSRRCGSFPLRDRVPPALPRQSRVLQLGTGRCMPRRRPLSLAAFLRAPGVHERFSEAVLRQPKRLRRPSCTRRWSGHLLMTRRNSRPHSFRLWSYDRLLARLSREWSQILRELPTRHLDLSLMIAKRAIQPRRRRVVRVAAPQPRLEPRQPLALALCRFRRRRLRWPR